ncbi:MAG: YraN family protein [Prevotella sp.]|nr:YraN family protein [Prevotella sp.]
MAQHNDTGKWGEELAADYLWKKGYTIRDTNWRCGHRDLDIVALDEDLRTLVFVEVKTRTSDYFTRPEEAVNREKIRSIGLAANAYVKQNRIMKELRFDIITVIGSEDSDREPIIEHWADAFNPMLVY